MLPPIDPNTAPAAQLAAHQARLDAAVSTAKVEAETFRRAVRDRYAPYTRTLPKGTHHLAAEDGTPITITIAETTEWDSDALGALVQAAPEFTNVVRAKYDVLQKDFKRIPMEAQAILLECQAIKPKPPIVSLGTTEEDQDQ